MVKDMQSYVADFTERALRGVAGLFGVHPSAKGSNYPTSSPARNHYLRNVSAAAGGLAILFGAGYVLQDRPERREDPIKYAMRIDASRRDHTQSLTIQPNSRVLIKDSGPFGYVKRDCENGRCTDVITVGREKVFEGCVSRVGRQRTNDYRNIFCDTAFSVGGVPIEESVEYRFDGSGYREHARFMTPNQNQNNAGKVRNFLSMGNDKNHSREFLDGLQETVGPSNALRLLVMAQNPNIPMPQDEVGMERYLEAAARKKGLDPLKLREKYKNDPEAYARDFYGHGMDAMLQTDTRLAIGVIFARRGMEAMGYTEYREHLNTMVEAGTSEGNWVKAYRNYHRGRDPSPEEIRMGVLTNSITYDPSRDRMPDANNYGATRQWRDPVSGASGSVETFIPGGTRADQARFQNQQNQRDLAAMRQQNAQRLQQDINKAAGDARRALDNFLKPNERK